MFEKNKIKKLFELHITSSTFNIEDGANVKLKLKAYKRFLKELNTKNILKRPNALENVINYYFQVEIYNLIIKFFEFKIDFEFLKDRIDYLNSRYNEILDNLLNYERLDYEKI